MKLRELVWDGRVRGHGAIGRKGRRRNAIQGQSSQYLYGHGRCVGYAIKIDADSYAFMRFGDLGQDTVTEVSKLELAALVAELVGSVP